MDARLFWLFVGCVIGFIAGYIVRSLREIKEKVESMDDEIKKSRRGDDGLIRYPLLHDMLLLTIVAFTAYAAILSQHSSNKVVAQQNYSAHTTACTTVYLADTIEALNSRTKFTLDQNAANLTLQRAQERYLNEALALSEGSPRSTGIALLRTYLAALHNYIAIASKSNTQAVNSPFPKEEDFVNCLNKK